jgi:hypothetical protein
MTAGRLVGFMVLAALGLVLSSCGGSANRGALLTTALPPRSVPATTTDTATQTDAGTTLPGSTQIVTMTETAPAETVVLEPETTTILVTTTTPQQVVTATVALTETVAVTETAPTDTSVNPAAAAAAGAAIASQNAAATSTGSDSQWGWIAFGILAAGVVMGAIWWLVKRRSPKPAPPA